jgi:hypothetical protein
MPAIVPPRPFECEQAGMNPIKSTRRETPGTTFARSATRRTQLRRRKGCIMLLLLTMLPLAAAGWAFLVWLCGGGLGLAIIVFIVLKLIGQ